jgi:hypothetical protein
MTLAARAFQDWDGGEVSLKKVPETIYRRMRAGVYSGPLMQFGEVWLYLPRIRRRR